MFRSTQYICLTNNTAQLDFFSLLRHVSDIYRFPTVHVVMTHFLLEICEYQSYTKVYYKKSHGGGSSLIQNIIEQYYF